eukprot:TRINITY_DN397_c0_g1_i4.p1 TRINITY_DN397_c0_g1~~TRINITY_DN397_c0_g1_i4.p1  ORF type:complete len:360 (-),score=117.94 TRINITY_DN397_c0_g1_i4:62-1141(-)
MESTLKHSIYQHTDIQAADAVAKAFIDKTPTMVEYPFKFPELKPYEVRLRILYTGLCHSDVHTVKSEWYPAQYPVVPGHEILGIITHVGSEVQNFKVGDRAGFGPQRFYCENCKACKRGAIQLCNGNLAPETLFLYDPYFGGYATQIQGPAKACVKIPEALPNDRTPPLLCAGVTVYNPIKRYVKAGDNVGIVGIGGLGHLAVKYAKAVGAHVTAYTSKVAEKKDELTKLGADEVRSSVDLEDLKTGAGTQDFVLTCVYVPGTLMEAYVNLVANGGTYCQIALPGHGEKLNLDIGRIVMGQIQVAGSLTGSIKDLEEMLEFSAKHNILPDCEIFEWEDFPTAFSKCEKGTAKYLSLIHI